MKTPTQSLRVVFALSTLACSVILVLFIHGRAQWMPGFWLQLVATSLALTTAVCFVAFRKGKMLITDIPLARFIGVFLRQLLLAYIASAIALTAIALAFIYVVTRTAPNAFALAVLAGLWISVWLAPGLASITSWFKLRPASGE